MSAILLVDDDRVALSALQTLLEQDGYQVVALRSSGDAVTALRRSSFDAVITDLEMPDVHGFEVVRAARAARPDMPVLVVTAYAGLPSSQQALDLGARRIFGKPVNYEALERELATAVHEPHNGNGASR